MALLLLANTDTEYCNSIGTVALYKLLMSRLPRGPTNELSSDVEGCSVSVDTDSSKLAAGVYGEFETDVLDLVFITGVACWYRLPVCSYVVCGKSMPELLIPMPESLTPYLSS